MIIIAYFFIIKKIITIATAAVSATTCVLLAYLVFLKLFLIVSLYVCKHCPYYKDDG